MDEVTLVVISPATNSDWFVNIGGVAQTDRCQPHN